MSKSRDTMQVLHDMILFNKSLAISALAKLHMLMSFATDCNQALQLFTYSDLKVIFDKV